MVKFEVSERAAHMMIAAMQIVSPSGGGSPQFTLARNLASQAEPYTLHDDLIEEWTRRFSKVVLEEAMEAGVIQRQELAF